MWHVKVCIRSKCQENKNKQEQKTNKKKNYFTILLNKQGCSGRIHSLQYQFCSF